MAKLHELLAVDKNLSKQADSTRADLINTFKNKKNHFTEKLTTFEPVADGAPAVTEEQLGLQTTVEKELEWISEHISKALDVSHQICVANTTAKADIILEDGTILHKDIPATSLLELEGSMNQVRELIITIPTLDPARGFEPAPGRGPGIYVARDVIRNRTHKISKPLVLYPANEKHPAQVQLVTEDVVLGAVKTKEWSGLLTTADKGAMLNRVEVLVRAIKKARARANEIPIEVAGNKIGGSLLKFVFEAKS